jgi:hypothetical protein
VTSIPLLRSVLLLLFEALLRSFYGEGTPHILKALRLGCTLRALSIVW